MTTDSDVYKPDFEWILQAATTPDKLSEASVLFALAACGASQIQEQKETAVSYMLTFLGLTDSARKLLDPA